MRRKSSKAGRGRQIVVVLVLFLAVGGLVVVAHLRVPLDLPVEEPPEMIAKRLDRGNNAYYVLVDAVGQLPEAPPPLELKDERGWPYKYNPKEGSLGELLRISRRDDDPELVAYIEGSRAAMARALQALAKPYFLMPPVPAGDEDAYVANLRRKHELTRLGALFLAEAERRPCSEEREEDACEYLMNGGRLLSMISEWSYYYGVMPYAVNVIKKASPEHLERVAAYCAECRREGKAGGQRFDDALRRTYAMQAGNIGLPHRARMREVRRVMAGFALAREKKKLRRIEPLVREAVWMTYVEYDRYRRDHPELDRYETGVSGFRWDSYVYLNSLSGATLDGIDLALGLERYKRDRGSYPETLDALVPGYLDELPKNPFDGGSYRYMLEGEDYALTCTGGQRLGDAWRRPGYLQVYAPPGWEGR